MSTAAERGERAAPCLHCGDRAGACGCAAAARADRELAGQMTDWLLQGLEVRLLLSEILGPGLAGGVLDRVRAHLHDRLYERLRWERHAAGRGRAVAREPRPAT